MLNFRAYPFVFAAVGIVLVIVFLNTSTPSYISDYSSTVLAKAKSRANGSSDVVNGTLGFQKVFAIGLPERSDKRDALALTSGLTGFHIDWIEGIKGETVVDKAMPFGVEREKLWNTNLGSWRSHMNAVRGIVEQNLTSALIMEDDMDWDINLKSQLVAFSTGAQYIQYPDPNDRQKPDFHSPYGDNWDLLWLGHCGEVFPETLDEHKTKSHDDPAYIEMSRKYVIDPDPTVPDEKHLNGFQDKKEAQHKRYIHTTGGPICTFAYALSQQGARKVLWELSVNHLMGAFDNALANMCRFDRDAKKLGMRCVSSTPGLFFHHKPKGFIGKDSDIQKVGQDGKMEIREKGFTENIVFSVRLCIQELLAGQRCKSQWEDEDKREKEKSN